MSPQSLITDKEREQVFRLCRGNPEAADWIQLGRLYCHEIDDLIDLDLPNGDRANGAERLCRIGAMAIALYTHPFFVKHAGQLGDAMLTNTNNYAQSVAWEKSPIEWQRQFSDWARHGWINVLLTVAGICGGYMNMRAESGELWEYAYTAHHDEKGEAI